MSKRKIDFQQTSIQRVLAHVAVSFAIAYVTGKLITRPLTDWLVPLVYKTDESERAAPAMPMAEMPWSARLDLDAIARRSDGSRADFSRLMREELRKQRRFEA